MICFLCLFVTSSTSSDSSENLDFDPYAYGYQEQDDIREEVRSSRINQLPQQRIIPPSSQQFVQVTYKCIWQFTQPIAQNGLQYFRAFSFSPTHEYAPSFNTYASNQEINHAINPNCVPQYTYVQSPPVAPFFSVPVYPASTGPLNSFTIPSFQFPGPFPSSRLPTKVTSGVPIQIPDQVPTQELSTKNPQIPEENLEEHSATPSLEQESIPEGNGDSEVSDPKASEEVRESYLLEYPFYDYAYDNEVMLEPL